MHLMYNVLLEAECIDIIPLTVEQMNYGFRAFRVPLGRIIRNYFHNDTAKMRNGPVNCD